MGKADGRNFSCLLHGFPSKLGRLCFATAKITQSQSEKEDCKHGPTFEYSQILCTHLFLDSVQTLSP